MAVALQLHSPAKIYIQLHFYYHCLFNGLISRLCLLNTHDHVRLAHILTTMAVYKPNFASIVIFCVLCAAAHPCSAANGTAEAHVAVNLPEPAVPDPVVPASTSGSVVATGSRRMTNNMVTVQMFWQDRVWFSGWFRSLGRAAQVRPDPLVRILSTSTSTSATGTNNALWASDRRMHASKLCMNSATFAVSQQHHAARSSGAALRASCQAVHAKFHSPGRSCCNSAILEGCQPGQDTMHGVVEHVPS